jgi:hypothetical protein
MKFWIPVQRPDACAPARLWVTAQQLELAIPNTTMAMISDRTAKRGPARAHPI